MNKQVVIDILKKIFAYYGYNTGSSEICDLLAEKGSEHLFIKFEQAANFSSIRHLSNNVQRYDGKGILISEYFDEKNRSFALEEGLIPWDRSELESRIGKAVLAGALVEQGEKTSASVQVPLTPEPQKIEKTTRISLRSVPITIGKSDALGIAEAKVGTVQNPKLKLFPVWYYSYSFRAQKKFRSKIVDLAGEGEGYINALTGENSFNKYKDIQDYASLPTQNYEIKQPEIDKKDAMGKAVDAVIREHAKEVRINEMIGDTIVFETKVFAPDPDDINLKMELVHIPIWEIKGKHETVEINGYDGQIMTVKVYHDAEFI